MRMAMHDGHDVGPRSVNLAVNEPLQVGTRPLRIDGRAIDMEFEDIAGRHAARRHVACQQEAIGLLVVADADMAERVHNAVVIENVIGATTSAIRAGLAVIEGRLNLPVA